MGIIQIFYVETRMKVGFDAFVNKLISLGRVIRDISIPSPDSNYLPGANFWELVTLLSGAELISGYTNGYEYWETLRRNYRENVCRGHTVLRIDHFRFIKTT